ncbi:carbohydrate sulfotransferase 14-like [Corticium candelabrum]|uniref:carbohydrate sulfotransferase 14-like n=1 Tax=Corticium candelabrum TaxID=121492 RepID=UPI002E25F6AA|nr:carbohydrate sulfotransferase 14-like [Corticium candelabrum]
MQKTFFFILAFAILITAVSLFATTQFSVSTALPYASTQITLLAAGGEKVKRRQHATIDIHNRSQINLTTAKMFLEAAGEELKLRRGRQTVTLDTPTQSQISGIGGNPDEVFSRRRNAVRATCKQTGRKKLGLTAPQMDDVYHHMIVDDKHKLIYCYVPKAACSSWKRVMLRLTGATDTRAPHERKNHLLMSDLPKSEREKRMKTYKKFMVHREPLGRLLSAYFDKFVKDDAMRLTFGRKIIYRYRSNPSRHSLKYGNDVTFREFARFAVDVAHKTRTIDMNEHWRSQVKLCQPCTVDYNYYSEMETVERDAEALLKIIGAPTHIKLPHLHNTNSAKNVTQFYGEVDRNLLGKLLVVYKEDVAIFGYSTSRLVI